MSSLNASLQALANSVNETNRRLERLERLGTSIMGFGPSGTVTSVALSAPSWLTVTGSPVLTTGTLTLAGTAQSAGTFLAGPVSGGSAAPTFRALSGTDVSPFLAGATNFYGIFTGANAVGSSAFSSFGTPGRFTTYTTPAILGAERTSADAAASLIALTTGGANNSTLSLYAQSDSGYAAMSMQTQYNLLYVEGHMAWQTTNTYDIGQFAVGTHRPRNIYAGTAFVGPKIVFEGSTSGTIDLRAPAIGTNNIVTFPDVTGTVVVTPNGTTGTFSKFTGPTTVGDSIINESGSEIYWTGSLKLKGAGVGYSIFSPPNVGADKTYTLPSSTGTLALIADIPSVPTVSGTTGRIPVFTGASAIGNSGFETSGAVISYSASTPVAILKAVSTTPTYQAVLKLETENTGAPAKIHLYSEDDVAAAPYIDLFSRVQFRTSGTRFYGSTSGSTTLQPTAAASGTLTMPAVTGTLLTGTGTSGKLPKFTGTNAVGDSLLSDDATTLTYAGGGSGFVASLRPDLLSLDGDGEQYISLKDSGTARLNVSAENGGVTSIQANETIYFGQLGNGTAGQDVRGRSAYMDSDDSGSWCFFATDIANVTETGDTGVKIYGYDTTHGGPSIVFRQDNGSMTDKIVWSNIDEMGDYAKIFGDYSNSGQLVVGGDGGVEISFNGTKKSLTADTLIATGPVYAGTSLGLNAISSPAYAATISLQVQTSNIHKITTVHATGNATINDSGAVGYMTVTFVIVNDATTGKVITFGTHFKPNGTLTGTASKTAVVTFVGDGTNFWEVSRTTGL